MPTAPGFVPRHPPAAAALAAGFGLLTAALAGVHTAGWVGGWEPLVRPGPDWAGIRQPAAVALLLVGVGVVLAAGRRRLAVLPAAAGFGLAAAVLAQAAAGVDMGVDRLLARSPAGTLPPGPASPVTAAGLLVAAAGVIASRGGRRSLPPAIAGSAVGSVAGAALLGYLLVGPGITAGWATEMAVYTAAGLAAAGAGLLALGWAARPAEAAGPPRWLPLPLAAGVLAGGAALALGLAARERADLRRAGLAGPGSPLPAVVLAAAGVMAALLAAATAAAQAAAARARLLAAEVRDRRAAEAAVAARERQYRELFDATPHPMWVFDPSTLRVLAVNAAAVARYGYTRDEFLGMTLADFRPPEDVPALLADVAAADPDDGPPRVWRHRWKDGTVREVEVAARPVEHAGRPARLALAADVTARRRAEAAVREGEAVLRLVWEAAGDGMRLTDAGGTVLAANPAYCRLVGRPEAEVVGRSLAAAHAEARRPDVLAGYRTRFAARAVPDRQRAWVELWDGRRRLFEVTNAFLDTPAGPPRLLSVFRDATDREAAEAAVRAERDRFEKLVEAVPDAVCSFELRPDGSARFPFASRRIEDIYGLPREALAADAGAAFARIHPGDAAAVRAAIAESARTLGAWRAEFRVLHPGRGEVWVRGCSAPARQPDGATVWHGLVADVTAEKRAAERLRESEERFRATFEQAAVGIAHAAPDGRLLLVNGWYAAITGYAREELLGRTLADITHPDDRPADAAGVARLLAGEAACYAPRKRFVRKDGAAVWVQVTVSVRRDAAGRPVHLIGVAQDIADRVRAEEALRASEARFRSVFEHAPTGIGITDPAGRFVQCNPAYCRVLGRTEGELRAADLAALIHPDDRAENMALLARLAAGEIPGYEVENRFLHKTGEPRWVRKSVTALRDAAGRTTHLIALVTDVTDRRRLEGQYRQAQKMEAVGRLAGGIAHDFNNLLTVINGYADLLLADTPAADRRRAAVAAVRDAGERAAALTGQLLAFGRKAIVAPRVVDLNELLARSDRLLRRLIGEDVRLDVVAHPAPCRVFADPGQLDQVVMNLAVNARDAMPTGGRLTIACRPAAGPGGGRVELEVADTGCGMTDAVKGRIFEPFFTTKGPGHGTGLGLATVYGIVEQAGGEVAVESEAGRGTVFRVRLPAAAEPAPAGPAAAAATAGRGTETVLLAEDEDSVRALGRIVLESHGYAVVAAGCGPDALAALADRPGGVDLLVTDVVMPGMSGRELADAVRAACPGAKVLFVSGYTDDAVVRHGVRDGADAFLQKPYTPAGLAGKVRQLLDGPCGSARSEPAGRTHPARSDDERLSHCR